VEIRKPSKPRKKVGLALGGGAARGLAHVGVLEVLEKEGILIDMIAGTSAGALIGALYAQGKDAGQIKNLVIDMVSRKFFFLADLTLLIKGRKIKDQMRLIIGDVEFSDLKMPFACVATDIGTGDEVIIKHGSVLEGIRASASIPVIFPIVKWEGRYLVDGGLVNPVPVGVLREMGADFIIAVNVIPDIRDRVQQASKEQKEPKEPNIFNVIMRTIHIVNYRAVRSSLEGADLVIEPDEAHIGFGDFHRAQECFLQGELAAQAAIPEIKKLLRI